MPRVPAVRHLVLFLFASLSIALLHAPAASARAGASAGADHLTMAWIECLSGGGQSTATFGCNANTIDFMLLPTFTLAQPADSVVGIEGVIDILSATDPLPSWWMLQPGGCREDGLSADMVFSGACTDPWQGNGVAAIQAYRVSPDVPTTNRGRLVFTSTVIASQKTTLAAGVDYHTARLILHTSRTFGATSCSGCSSTACLVLNSVTLKRVPGATGPDIVVSDPATTANWSYWLGSVGVDCAAVPVHNRTWGAIKSLYR